LRQIAKQERVIRMELKLGDTIVDLDVNGKEISEPYAVTEEFLSEYNNKHIYYDLGTTVCLKKMY